MSFFSDFSKGISFHIKAFEFIAKHRLWAYFLYPIAIMLILGIFGFWSTFSLGGKLADDVISLIGLSDPGEGWLHWVNFILSFLIGLILKVFLFFVFSSFLKFIVLIVCSPIMALLSERVDEINSEKKYPFRFKQFLHDIFRGISVTFRNMFFETLIIFACMLIGWIPIIGWIVVPFLWIIGWYFLGFNMMDYTYERRKLKVSEGAIFTRKHKGIAIGNGMIFSFLLMIPFLGIALAPVLSVVAATLATIDTMERK
ncbi:MAG: EI24 domain-containing protein [Bacteroidetes bacterium]|nr:EI24 domain-containing protein [Bacteroidota bacterium]